MLFCKDRETEEEGGTDRKRNKGNVAPLTTTVRQTTFSQRKVESEVEEKDGTLVVKSSYVKIYGCICGGGCNFSSFSLPRVANCTSTSVLPSHPWQLFLCDPFLSL